MERKHCCKAVFLLPENLSLFQSYPSISLFAMNDQEAFAIAVEEAKLGYSEGGVPVRPLESSQTLPDAETALF